MINLVLLVCKRCISSIPATLTRLFLSVTGLRRSSGPRVSVCASAGRARVPGGQRSHGTGPTPSIGDPVLCFCLQRPPKPSRPVGTGSGPAQAASSPGSWSWPCWASGARLLWFTSTWWTIRGSWVSPAGLGHLWRCAAAPAALHDLPNSTFPALVCLHADKAKDLQINLSEALQGNTQRFDANLIVSTPSHTRTH